MLVAPVRKVRERHVCKPRRRGVAEDGWRRLLLCRQGFWFCCRRLRDERRVVRVHDCFQIRHLTSNAVRLSPLDFKPRKVGAPISECRTGTRGQCLCNCALAEDSQLDRPMISLHGPRLVSFQLSLVQNSQQAGLRTAPGWARSVSSSASTACGTRPLALTHPAACQHTDWRFKSGQQLKAHD